MDEGKAFISRQIDRKSSRQVRIDAGWHRQLKLLSADSGESIKALLEWCLAEYYPKLANKLGHYDA